MRPSFVAALALLVSSLAGCVHGSADHGTLHANQVFTLYTPLSKSVEIARRTLPPLTYEDVLQALLGHKERLNDQAIDLTKEKFSIYVPGGPPPPSGYGLLVYIPPWEGPTHPKIWRPPLDRRGIIFVAADDSGNERSVLDRRVPLALLAYENVRARFPIDPRRVYVGGLSGGSRVAEITAMAYPDVFRGALLNAGSDPINGQSGMFMPPADLFHQFQRTRLVYITGDADEANLDRDGVSQESMHDACVFDVKIEIALDLAHQSLDESSMDRALRALEEPPSIKEDELASCNARLQREVDAKVAAVAASIARGDRDGARKEMRALQGYYGGLVGPALLELKKTLQANAGR